MGFLLCRTPRPSGTDAPKITIIIREHPQIVKSKFYANSKDHSPFASPQKRHVCRKCDTGCIHVSIQHLEAPQGFPPPLPVSGTLCIISAYIAAFFDPHGRFRRPRLRKRSRKHILPAHTHVRIFYHSFYPCLL